jgi:flavin reductase (DIM6/NTAB) family NADH-FMN oxidoreductase RutF
MLIEQSKTTKSEEKTMHRVIEPKILYFGTPVVLISSLNEDGSTNLAPMSSAWWLGQSCMLGLGTHSKTFENLERERECVLNLPSSTMVDAIDRLALTTRKEHLPEYKQKMGFRFIRNKFEEAHLTPSLADLVKPHRVAECPIQLEAKIMRIDQFGRPEAAALEARVIRVHVEEHLLRLEHRHHIDPNKWQPLIMNFLEFYGLSARIHPSRLAEVF